METKKCMVRADCRPPNSVTKAMEEMISGGRSVFLALEDLTPIQGGLPVMLEGQAIAGIGVSGVQSSQDEQVAQAGISGLQK